MDDFGEFTGFSDGNNSGVSAAESKEPPAPGPSFNSEVFSLDSFQGLPGSGVGNGTQEFAGFSQFGNSENGNANVHIAGGVPFEIPPLPVSPTGENFHIVGGVPFEIPPLPPDLSFDDVGDMPELSLNGGLPNIQDLTSSGSQVTDVEQPGMVSGVGNGLVNSTSESSTAQGTDLASWQPDFSVEFPATSTSDSSPPLPKVGVFSSSGSTKLGSSNSTADPEASNLEEFGDFPPLPTTVEASGTHIPSGTDEAGDFGEFGGFTTGSGREGFEEPSSEPVIATATSSGKNEFSAVVTATSTAGNEDFTFPSDSNVAVTAAATAVSSSSAAGGDDFGEFGGFPATTTVTSAGGDDFGEFGGFSSGTVTATTGDSSFPVTVAAAAASLGDEDFGGFSSNTVTTSSGGDDFGEFGGFSSNTATVTASSGGDDFGEFGGFSSNTATVPASSGGGDFGEFGGFSSNTVASSGGDDFGGFSSNVGPPKSEGGDDFGEFGGFSSPTPPAKGGEDFGEFGGFSSATGQGNTGSTTPTSLTGKLYKSAATILGACLSEQAPPPAPPSSPTLSTLSKLLSTRSRGTESGQIKEVDESLWLVLQRCVDLTVPLHKFDKSFLQSCYYSSLAVDPMLISRPSTLAVLTGMARFEAPLGGVTAVEDLRESFGFEGELAEPGSPTATTTQEQVTSPFKRQASEKSAALLDLSLPLSPNSPTRDSFTLTADLAGLDLNPQPAKQDQPLTSIQELLLNERLVVNRSTWMDSQLAELGGGVADHTQGEGPANTSQPGTPHLAAGKKGQSSMELQLEQLGLDVSKTTLPKGSSTELSLMARSVLGRLPDLSFMGHVDRLESTKHYFRTLS